MNELNIPIYIISAIFFIIGMLTWSPKMHEFMIAYHKMPKARKKIISIEKYAKVWRTVLLSFSFLSVLGMLVFQYLGIYKYFMFIYFPIIIIAMLIFLIVYHKIK